MNNELIPQKELEVYKGQLDTAERFGLELLVKNDSDYQRALVEGKSIKERLEIITKRKEEITKPLNASLKSVRDFFRPMETRLDDTLRIIKAKMLAYTEEKERKVEINQKKIEARLEKGTISQAEANVKTFMNRVDKTVVTESGSATTKKVKKYYVTDIGQVPLEFLEVDMIKVRASFKSGMPVPGIEERVENELQIK